MRTSLIIVVGLTAATAWTSAQESGSITLKIGYTDVDGNQDAYEARTNQEDGFVTAITNFTLKHEYDNGVTLNLEGLVDPYREDASFDIDLVNLDWGQLTIHYDQFQTDYHSLGAYTPDSSQLYVNPDSLLSIDRRNLSISGTLDREDLPTIWFKYNRRERDGSKSSTHWSEQHPSPLLGRGIVPSTLQTNETRDSIEIGIDQDIATTSIGASYRYEETSVDDNRYINRSPGNESTQRFVTQNDVSESKTNIARAYLDSSPDAAGKFRVTTAASYVDRETNFNGSRIYGDAFDAPYGSLNEVRRTGDTGFYDLTGLSDLYQFQANANLRFKPNNNWTLIGSTQLEKISKKTVASQEATDWARDTTTFEFTGGESLVDSNSQDDYDELTGRLEARYTGIKKVSLYARSEYTKGDGYIIEDSNSTRVLPNPDATEILVSRENDYKRESSKSTLGFRYYLKPGLTFGARYVYEDRTNEYTPIGETIINNTRLKYPNYVARHDRDGSRIRASLNWRPHAKLSLATLVQIQERDITTVSIEETSTESGTYESYTVSQSLTWSPTSKINVHASAAKSNNTLETPANLVVPTFGGATAQAIVPSSENQVWYATLTSNFRLSETKTLEINYAYLETGKRTDNFYVSVPYGQNLTEHIAGLVYHIKLSENKKLSLGYQFHDSVDAAFYGYADYTAHQVYTVFTTKF